MQEYITDRKKSTKPSLGVSILNKKILGKKKKY